jgi:cardiolipin synthase
MPWNFPIFLTWMRVLLIPVFTALFFLPKGVFDNHTINWLAAAIFAIAAITDWFDGFLARRWKQTSDFGAFLPGKSFSNNFHTNPLTVNFQAL